MKPKLVLIKKAYGGKVYELRGKIKQSKATKREGE